MTQCNCTATDHQRQEGPVPFEQGTLLPLVVWGAPSNGGCQPYGSPRSCFGPDLRDKPGHIKQNYLKQVTVNSTGRKEKRLRECLHVGLLTKLRNPETYIKNQEVKSHSYTSKALLQKALGGIWGSLPGLQAFAPRHVPQGRGWREAGGGPNRAKPHTWPGGSRETRHRWHVRFKSQIWKLPRLSLCH